jgi:hypothetical protein
VYDKLREYARIVKGKGLRCSIYFLIELIPWFYMIETQGAQAKDFTLNNNVSPFFARKLMAENPDLAGCSKSAITFSVVHRLATGRSKPENTLHQFLRI